MKTLIAILLWTISIPAHALFLTDYFHDTDTGLDWLNGRYTQGLAYNQVSSVFNVAGGGWRTASVQDVHGLFERLFPDYQANTPYGTYVPPTGVLPVTLAADVGRFQALFGTVGCVSTGQCSYGLYGDSGPLRLVGTYLNPGDFPQIYGPDYTTRFERDQPNDLFFTFLVKGESVAASVPEPGPMALLAVGLLGLAARRVVRG